MDDRLVVVSCGGHLSVATVLVDHILQPPQSRHGKHAWMRCFAQ